jgi:hypothetical protein
MRKIFTKGVLEYNKRTKRYELNRAESKWYYIADDAPIIHFGGGDSGGSTTTVQKADPWPKQQPYLERGFEQIQKYFMDQAPPAFYPNSTVIPFSPETEFAMDLQTQRALQGSPIEAAGTEQLTKTLAGDYLNDVNSLFDNPTLNASNQNIQDTLSGKYLYGGDGFNAAFDAASRRILPQVSSQFEAAGRTRSGLADVAKTQALGDAFANLYGQERQNQLAANQQALAQTQARSDAIGRERDNVIRSMLFAPQMADRDYQNIAKLAEVGAQREDMDQQRLAEDIARWDYGQSAKQNQLLQYMNAIQGNYGSNTSQVSKVNDGSNSGLNSILGGVGGLLGASSLGISPIMGLLGGALGGI